MHLKKRLFSVILVLAVCAGTLWTAGQPKEEVTEESLFSAKETLYLWYTDDALTEYLTNMSAAYYEETGYHIVPVLHSGLEYLEDINEASIHENEAPDLYIIGNDSLEKAYLAGLASEVRDDRDEKDRRDAMAEGNFPETALRAVSYRDKYVAYPFYYETSALLYNKTYIQEAAKTLVEAEADREAAEAAQEAAEAGETDAVTEDTIEGAEETEVLTEEELLAEAEEKIPDVIPKTIDDILTFANEYDAPEQVEAVFKWDVSDIFYNYYFVGNYMTVGGKNGDAPEEIDIYNENTKRCLKVYQDLNQFFSIDTREVNYDSVIQDFIDGKTVLTVATSDAIAKMEAAKEEGTFAYEYGIAKMPDLSQDLKGKSLSVTNGIVVNGYSEKKEIANDFAGYLAYSRADDLYESAGKLASRYNVSYENENVAAFMEEYEQSIPMPKILGTGNFWVQLEICFSKIWSGEDIDRLLLEFAEKMKEQMGGQSG